MIPLSGCMEVLITDEQAITTNSLVVCNKFSLTQLVNVPFKLVSTLLDRNLHYSTYNNICQLLFLSTTKLKPSS